MLPVLPDVKVDNGRAGWLGLASAAHADYLGGNVHCLPVGATPVTPS